MAARIVIDHLSLEVLQTGLPSPVRKERLGYVELGRSPQHKQRATPHRRLPSSYHQNVCSGPLASLQRRSNPVKYTSMGRSMDI